MTTTDVETIGYLISVLITAGGAAIAYYKKIKPIIQNQNIEISDLTANLQLILAVISQIRSLIQTYKDATEDGTISPEEAKKVLTQVQLMVDSPEVKKLIKEFEGSDE